MRINRSLLNWGVFLIALGGIPLAVDQGWLESDIAGDLGQLWPLILVGIGLGLILRWTPLAWFGGRARGGHVRPHLRGSRGVAAATRTSTNLQGIIPAIASGACANSDIGGETTSGEGIASGTSFALDLSLPCGELSVARAADTTWRVEAVHEAGDRPRIDETEDASGTTALRIRYDGDGDLAFIGRQTRSRWDVLVPAGASLTVQATLDAARGTIDSGPGPVARLEATLNASDATLDLAQAETPETARIELTLNASDGQLLLPMGTTWTTAELNASSLEVCAPSSLPLQVELSETLSSSDLEDAGLEETDAGTWVTPGFSSTSDHAILELESTVSSLSIERPEACS